MLTIIKKIGFIACLLLLSHSFIHAKEKENLSESRAFFTEKMNEYQVWLLEMGLNEVKIDSLNIQENKVNLYVSTPNFYSTYQFVQLQQQQGLPQFLMDKMLFLFDLNFKQAGIYFKLRNARYSYQYSKRKNEFKLCIESVRKTHKAEKTHSRIFKRFFLQKEEVKIRLLEAAELLDSLSIRLIHSKIDYQHSESSSYNTIKDVKKRLSKGLNLFFKGHQTTVEHYAFNPYTVSENQYHIEVKNIQNLVLEKFGFFEYVQIQFYIYKSNGKITLKYKLNCKYASGMLWAPRLSAYHDAEKDYKASVLMFNEKLKGKINEILYQ